MYIFIPGDSSVQYIHYIHIYNVMYIHLRQNMCIYNIYIYIYIYLAEHKQTITYLILYLAQCLTTMRSKQMSPTSDYRSTMKR